MNSPNSDESTAASRLTSLEQHVIDVFSDGGRVLGLPKSLGEIYGLLFISQSPLSLDDIVLKLELSKGSASQGLRMLRSLGAVRESDEPKGRRTLYEPDVDLKRLVGGFIREQVRPHVDSGLGKIRALQREAEQEQDPDLHQFYTQRVEKLDTWLRRGRVVLPLIQKLLGE